MNSKEIIPGVLVGDSGLCRRRHSRENSVVLHACKYPCYKKASCRDSPYLFVEKDSDLFLNLVDPPTPLFYAESFHKALSFSKEKAGAGYTLVYHCNKGESRSPSLALLYLASIGKIPSSSFQEAREAFESLYPRYSPGRGIETYLEEAWGLFVN